MNGKCYMLRRVPKRNRLSAFDRDKLIRHSLIVFLFTHTVSFANMLFQMVMRWNLPVAEYGVLYSMLQLTSAVAMPMSAVQNTLAHFTGNLVREGKPGHIRGLARQWINRILPAGIILLLLTVILRNYFAAFFNLATFWPLVPAALTLFVSGFTPIFSGVLQGKQAFVLMGFPGLAFGFLRLGLGCVFLFLLAPTALYGLAANAIGALASAALAYVFYHRSLPQSEQADQAPPERSGRYFWASVAALSGFSILMNMDVVLVQHYFKNPADSGNYASASMIARTLVFLIQPIASAMFPKVSSRGAATNEQKFTFFKSLALSGLIIAAAVLLCALFPQIPLLILCHEKAPSPQMIALVRLVCWAMAPLGLVFMLMNFELAQHRLACVFPLTLCAIAFLGGVALFHNSLHQVVTVFLTVSLAALAMLVIISFRKTVGDPAVDKRGQAC